MATEIAGAPGGATQSSEDLLIDVQDLKVYFPVVAGFIVSRKIAENKAVDGITFNVKRGETVGLVGESGCGKSTTGRAILQLYKPTGGHIIFDGKDISALHGEELRHTRRRMQMIFQDPYASLNPRMSVRDIIGEPLLIHKLGNAAERRERVAELMRIVGLNPYYATRFPHEFSGGQRQRIGIARSLAVSPDFIVCDEPVSALDVSIQAQIINLLEELQEQFGLTYLFIAHDLAVVRHISDRVAVMYLGKMMELSDRNEIYDNPLHPYTKSLLSAVPIPDPALERKRERIILTGDVPSSLRPPRGCVFHTRCPIAIDECREAIPEWREVQSGHWVACHRV
jgi:oligopeptide/dipeptide ABC transporter ATP-binding protein